MGHLSKLIDPKVFYARLLIWKLPLFSQYDAVLHLDADTLVLQDLSKLFQKKEFYIEKECYNWEDSLFYNKHDSELLKLIISDWLIIPKSFQPWNAWGNTAKPIPKIALKSHIFTSKKAKKHYYSTSIS